jgi:AGCS family alanine or glycine:cation symporter
LSFFAQFWAVAVDYAWGLPLVFLLIGAGIYFSFAGRFIPFRGLRHAIDIIRGKLDDPNDPGEISHFQALTAALSATIGMGNIAGVAIAVTLGGPGAVFWMWVAGLVGMSTKFFTCTMAVMYRKKDERGIDQGGPMYYIEVGLGRYFKPLAVMFAVFGMIGCLAMFQANQLSGLLENDYGVARWVTGVACAFIVGVVILGGIVRVGKVTSKVVPAMFVLYVIAALYIIAANLSSVPAVFEAIITSAFGGKALLGGGTAVAFREVIVTGIKRAAFSNEAGIGTAPMAHGAAKTKEPIREGLIAMLGPFLDTNIVCTMTALVILVTGVPAAEDGVVMTVSAFEKAMPGYGAYILAIVIVLFSISTMISYSYYSLKCSRYLFGFKFGSYYVYVYILSLFFAAVWTQEVVINILDTSFAMMAVPTLLSTLLLSPAVVRALKDYFRRMNM